MSSSPDPVDIHVGHRVRLRRTLLGMSQEKLGNSLGLTFQQIQKYERGANRIGSSRLYKLSQILDVPVSYFFEEMAEKEDSCDGFSETETSFEHDDILKRETLELVRSYYKIEDSQTRKRLFDLVRSVSSSQDLTDH